MASLQEEVRAVCKLADKVLDDPAIPIPELESILPWGTSIPYGPNAPIARWLIKKEFEKNKREEKERMLREVIRKQQAVIRRLNKELEENQRLHMQNQEKIKNLEEMLQILEDTLNEIEAA